MIISKMILNREKYILSALIAIVMMISIALIAVPTANALSARTVTEKHTPEEIIEKWHQYKPAFSGDPFLIKSQADAPYATGKLNPEFVQDGINMANFVRFLTGLPDDLVQDQSLNDLAQYGAVLLAAANTLTHYPTKPQDMDNNFFDIGTQSTTSSNINMGSSTTSNMVLGYMSDSDHTNIDRVGHRRWILNPPLKRVGFGYALNISLKPYSTMQIFDKSGVVTLSDPMIAWPSPGAFPTVAFNYGDAWSVDLNSAQYQIPSMNDVNVILKRVNDGRVWNFDKSNNGLPDVNKDYFNVDGSGIGAGSSIIFRPANAGRPTDRDVYEVEIRGIKTISGEEATISYSVSFFDIPNKGYEEAYLTKWRMPREAISQLPYRFKSSSIEQSVRMKLGIKEDVITEADLGRISTFSFDYEVGDSALDEDILPKLTGVQNLVISSPRAAGFESIANLRELTELSVRTEFGNRPIHNLKPLSYLKQLRNLTLAGSIPEEELLLLLEQLPNLKLLDVEDDQLTDLSFIPSALMNNLIELKVSSDGLRDVSALNNAGNLLSLMLGGYEVPLLDIRPITSLSSLKWLELNALAITDADLVPISKMTGLTTLNLRNNQLRDISSLSTLTKLDDINLSGNKIRDISVLSKMPSLKWIDIGFNGISDITPIINANLDIEQLAVRANFLDLTKGGATRVWLDNLARKPMHLESIRAMVTDNTVFYDSQQENRLWYYEWSDLTDMPLDDRSLVVGDSIPAKIVARYLDYNDKIIDNSNDWKSSNPEVLKIKDGKLTALRSGYATIHIKSGDLDEYVSFQIISRPNMEYFYSKSLTDTMSKQLQYVLVLGVGKDIIITDGTLKTIDAKPLYDAASASTLLPVRVVSEKLESDVKWDKTTQTAIITNDDNSIRIEVQIGAKKMKVNDKIVDISVAAKIVDGNVYLPLRALCDALGKQVTYYNGVITIANHSLNNDEELLRMLSKMYSLKE